jgi:hypothetical protein
MVSRHQPVVIRTGGLGVDIWLSKTILGRPPRIPHPVGGGTLLGCICFLVANALLTVPKALDFFSLVTGVEIWC